MSSGPNKHTRLGKLSLFNVDRVILSGIHEKYRYKFDKAGITDIVKEENIYATIDNAVEIMYRSRSFGEISKLLWGKGWMMCFW